MVNVGDIIYFDELVFKNKMVDKKKKRPCIVLLANDETSKVMCVPLTSQIKSFNKYNYKYYLVPAVIYNYFKMNFASLENLVIRDYADVNNTGLSVDQITVENIINKIIKNPTICDEQTVIQLIEKQQEIKEELKRKEKNEKILRKQLRKEKRQQRKC